MSKMFDILPEDWPESHDAMVGSGIEATTLSQNDAGTIIEVPDAQADEAERILNELRRRPR